jgi:benzaldehyde dehydrogenase (NAD)
LRLGDVTMHGKEDGLLADAAWNCGDAEPGFNVTDKATGKVLGKIALSQASDVSAAARIAKNAQPAWAATSPAEKAAVFRRAANLLETHYEEAQSFLMREAGATRAKADFELRHMTLGILYNAAAMTSEPQGLVLPASSGTLSLGRRVPHGVVAVIAPFNVPVVLAIRAVAPALATGNAVLLKPDPQTAVSGGHLIARLFELAGLPEGVLHVLPGGADVGEALCTDDNISMVAFTGSTSAGRRVGELCGRHLKKVSLELGGKNSIIVLDDADIEVAAKNISFGAFLNQGQVCMAVGRALVHRSLMPKMTELLVATAKSLPVGDTSSQDVALGPLINTRQVENVDRIVRSSVQDGAVLAAGGTFESLFYTPTVLSHVRPGMAAFEEEIFGPVISLTSFETDDEAVQLANQTEYGLSASVISRSVGRAMNVGQRLRVGLLHVNDQPVHDEPHVPFGGRGSSGNGTSIGGPANWDEFTQWQWMTVKDNAPRYPF